MGQIIIHLSYARAVIIDLQMGTSSSLARITRNHNENLNFGVCASWTRVYVCVVKKMVNT